MSKYKFILSLPDEFEIDSEYEIDGHMAWPNYSQADPVRYRGIFNSYEEAKKYAEDFDVYKYILKYYYSHPYDSFEDEDECAKYFISIFDAEDAACAELGISPGDMVTPSEYKVEQIKRGNSKKGIPTGAYKYRLFDHGKCFLDSVKDNDEYFEDDLANKIFNWVEVVYGKETLEENLKFIADALGGKGTPREAIRNYLLTGFYTDHLKIYQKRPIYWLFSSGKKNGFKALIYMHRYAPDTIARIRTDYVHEQQARYRTILTSIEQRLDNASTAERVKINKELALYKDKEKELHDYEEKIHHLADQMISIDLDDGVKNNYAIFGDVLAKIK
jgi:hypothetical protein